MTQDVYVNVRENYKKTNPQKKRDHFQVDFLTGFKLRVYDSLQVQVVAYIFYGFKFL